ncbi:hypothetical protein ABFT23_03645 [Nocardioides sp. C4-1]|uniref:hypothetical protein n=1 Tax=Nocardioides sp. C4-1 TaxID=3151851 RepID=UPI003265DA4F
MTRRSPLLVVPALLLALSLTGCGGDDGDGGDSSGGGGGDTVDGGDLPALQGEDCDAEVTLSGAVEASWSGNGTVSTAESGGVAPPASYQTSKDGMVLTLLSTGNGFDAPSVLLLISDTESYTVTPGEGSVEVAEDGSGATVDAPAGMIGTTDSVDVQATFDC